MDIEQTLKDRGNAYGDYATIARMTQAVIKTLSTGGSNVALRTATHNETLHMVAHKLARVAVGDPNHEDTWRDIAGYATLMLREAQKEKENTQMSDEVPMPDYRSPAHTHVPPAYTVDIAPIRR